MLDEFIERHRTDRSMLEKLLEALEEGRRQAKTAEGQGSAVLESGEARYSINEAFREEVAAWDWAGRPEGEWFTLGSTGPVMQGLGAIESDIFMEGDKIGKILYDHPEMTIREIQRIPEILEDPVLVMKSQGGNRLVMFGSLKARDGRLVMCVLDLRPMEKGFLLNDMQKVNSAYTKDSNPVGFIQKSDILHADKKRTIPLLRGMGLTNPMSLLRDGSVGSISYSGQNVNIEGVPFSEVVKLGSMT